MEEKDFGKSECVPLARKSRGMIIERLVLTVAGFIFANSVLIVTIVQHMFFIDFLLCITVEGVCFILPLVSLILTVKKPNVLVSRDGEMLNFYYKKQWVSVKLSDTKKINYRTTTFLQIHVRSGEIILTTVDKRYVIYDIENVAEATFEIKKELKTNEEDDFYERNKI